MYSLLKIFLYLIYPISLCILLMLASLFFRKRKEKFSLILGLSSLVLLVLFSNQLFSYYLIKPLEKKYPSLTNVEPYINDVHYVVVLSGMSHFDDSLSLTSQLGSANIIRLSEAVDLHKKIPESRLIISGGGTKTLKEADLLKKMALVFGVSQEKIILEKESNSTSDQAVKLKNILKDEKFVLVTSARHMPRSMALFKKQNMNPIAAPVGYLATENYHSFFDKIIPHVNHLSVSSEAFYEYLGFAKEFVAGNI